MLAKFAFCHDRLRLGRGVTTILAASCSRCRWAGRPCEAVVMFAVCAGLCGLAVGIGARMPMFEERNAARIANGLGGTINLVVSVVLVLAMLCGMGLMGIRNVRRGFEFPVDAGSLLIGGLVATLGVTVGAVALLIGARHLRHREV
ncbi:MAG: hypothetical protein H6816_11820 [Phycisphaerales bacterium]|nr:hypothetical protein [Phycisphaerales bacterium]